MDLETDLYKALAAECPSNSTSRHVREPLKIPTLAIFASGMGMRDPIKDPSIRIGLGILLKVESRKEPVLILAHAQRGTQTTRNACHVGFIYNTVSNAITAISDLSPRNGWVYTLFGSDCVLADQYRNKGGGPGFHNVPDPANLLWLVKSWKRILCNSDANPLHYEKMIKLYDPDTLQETVEDGLLLYNTLLQEVVTFPDALAKTRIVKNRKQSTSVPRPRPTRLDGESKLRGTRIRSVSSITIDLQGRPLVYIQTECGRGWALPQAVLRIDPQWASTIFRLIVELFTSVPPNKSLSTLISPIAETVIPSSSSVEIESQPPQTTMSTLHTNEECKAHGLVVDTDLATLMSPSTSLNSGVTIPMLQDGTQDLQAFTNVNDCGIDFFPLQHHIQQYEHQDAIFHPMNESPVVNTPSYQTVETVMNSTLPGETSSVANAYMGSNNRTDGDEQSELPHQSPHVVLTDLSTVCNHPTRRGRKRASEFNMFLSECINRAMPIKRRRIGTSAKMSSGSTDQSNKQKSQD